MTHTATIVLGLAAQKPCGPYEMLKVLEKVNIRRWYKVSDASIYLAVRKLESGGLLAGRPVREGNNPEKRVYSATAEGLATLSKTLQKYIESPAEPKEAIDIAILFLCHIPKEAALDALARRTDSLASEIGRAEKLYARTSSDLEYPFNARMMIRHNALAKQALLTTLEELRHAAEASERWDFFVAKNL